jgi:hydrogenase maturation factor
MNMQARGKRVSVYIAGLLSVAFVALLSACTPQPGSAGNSSITPNKSSSIVISSKGSFTTPDSIVQTSVIELKHNPVGSADLSWQSENHQLTVKITLTGLAPNSSHAAHIHAGTCASSGAVVYPLNTVVADAKGDATSQTTINNVQDDIPDTGWYINVHNGTTMAAIDDRPIACGNISLPENNQEGGDTQSVQVVLAGTTALNESASGQAQFTMENGKLALKITLNGLEPNSQHVAHIHSGSCQAQGPVVVMLNSVVADAQGHGISITPLDQMPSSAQGLYINVHTGATMAELGQSVFFNPIACGNV